ncbi:hypothetical protein RB195_011397 [Necator americanus]|uniref:EGF-like domain-containing protein n=1 Tax=Necator americanus TaxID=51031 RepID=A0ABR1D3C6_NECAM
MLTVPLIILLFGLHPVQALPATLTCNNSTEFDCETPAADPHRCIPLEWLCDGLKDCKSGLDEFHCSYLHSCPEGNFICRSGDCVSGKFKCDGEIDCPGGEDEKGCDYPGSRGPGVRSAVMDCPDHMFHCSYGPCVARAYVCDGEEDCPLGEDERNCTRNRRKDSRIKHELTSCDPGMILCADHAACFPKHWVCDGEPDCLDGSDESDCELSVDNFLAETVTELCHPGEHRCNGGMLCIAMNRTCDGTIDCPDGDDEAPLCNECRTRKIPCEYNCVNTPLGSSLNPDEHTCSQINECETNEAKLCQHYCEDRHIGYQCTCAPGYRLGADEHSCRLDRDHEGMLFVALGHEVRAMPLFDSRTSTSGYETAQSIGSLGVVRSIDFHGNQQLIYMTIAGSNLNGEIAVSSGGLLRIIRENVAGVGQVAVDWIGGNFYLTHRYPSLTPGISVCTEDGFFCRRIVKGLPADPVDHGKKQQYRGIALHPQRGAIVWIESYGSRHRIVSANMNGKNIRILVDNKLEYPTGLSIDLIRSDVYFGDVERQMIERVNMDTKQRIVVLTQAVHHPYDLRYFNGFLYWTDWATSSLKVSELSIHHESAHIIHSFTTLPYGLAINHTMYQPAPSMNPCAGSGCQWICVSIPNVEGEMQPQCLCPDGYKTEENGDCAPIDPTDNTSAEDSNAKPSVAVASMDKSHVGVAWMKERCQAGDGCLNGGQCHEIKNEHGRVTKILCSCESPYEGHRCERLNPEKELAKQIAASKKSIWITVFFIILFLSLFIGAFFISYRYVEPISKTTKSILTSMERRLVTIPPPTMPNLSPIITSMKSRLASTMAARSPRSASVLRTEFTNPLFDDRSSNGSSPEEPVNDATALTYNNPLYVEDTSHAAPFSGIHVTYTNKFTPP